MSASAKSVPCVACGAPAENPLFGLCRSCLLEGAVSKSSEGGRKSDDLPVFGDYELEKQIGRGGMGVVYRARQCSLAGRCVALKLILDSHHTTPEILRRFRIEAEAAAKLDHPNIVPIYQFGEVEGQPFLSMKLITGGTLREWISSGRLCLRKPDSAEVEIDVNQRAIDIVRVMVFIARAVQHAHEHGVLHRDLKPSNILIDSEGVPHLTDFGVAKFFETELEDSALLKTDSVLWGTPPYMSPEQARGSRLSAASDTYSLGAVFYHMLTGRPVFQGPTVLDTLRIVGEQPPRSPRAVNPLVDGDLATICLKCLEKIPAARYSSAGAFADDLERWLRREPILARPAGPVLRLIRWIERNPLGSAFIALLFASLAVTVVLLNLAANGQRRLNLIQANTSFEFSREIQELWENKERTYIEITASRLAAMAQTSLREPSTNQLRLQFGCVIGANPYGQAQDHAKFLTMLQESMEKTLRVPVLIDLRLYKSSHSGMDSPVAVGAVDFQRLGPVRYVHARQKYPEIQPAVFEVRMRDAVLFARAGIGINHLLQLRGHRAAFAESNSTISFIAKTILVDAGITAGDLLRTEELDARSIILESGQLKEELHGGDVELYPHREVIRRVLSGEFDAGQCSARHFQMYQRQGLVELCRYTPPPDVIVARPGLDLRVVEAFQKAACALRSPREQEVLARLRHGLEGFEVAYDSAFDSIRGMLTNQWLRFHAEKPGSKL